MFCCAAFVFGSIGQEFFRGMRARAAMADEAPPVALVALVRRNRRRYGGYIVHIGIAVLFVGVAASSSFQHASELGLSPGQSTRVGAYTVRYVRPTASVTPDYDSAGTQAGRELSAIIRSEPGVTLGPDTARTGSTLSLGAVLDVTKHGRHVTTLHPSEGYYASEEPSQGSVGHLIGGQPVSHVALDAGVTRDVWTAIEPNIETPQLKRIVDAGQQDAPTSIPERAIVAIAATGARLPAASAAGAVPLHRLAAGDVDLDRRPDRGRRRPDRDLAGAERRPPPRGRALARSRRARPGTRLSASLTHALTAAGAAWTS